MSKNEKMQILVQKEILSKKFTRNKKFVFFFSLKSFFCHILYFCHIFSPSNDSMLFCMFCVCWWRSSFSSFNEYRNCFKIQTIRMRFSVWVTHLTSQKQSGLIRPKSQRYVSQMINQTTFWTIIIVIWGKYKDNIKKHIIEIHNTDSEMVKY